MCDSRVDRMRTLAVAPGINSVPQPLQTPRLIAGSLRAAEMCMCACVRVCVCVSMCDPVLERTRERKFLSEQVRV
jgi:hypothetical protein